MPYRGCLIPHWESHNQQAWRLCASLLTQSPCTLPAKWRSRKVTVRLTCARNIVFQHKINFCVDVERMVYFQCVWRCSTYVSFKIPHIDIGFVCVYFQFTLLSRKWWSQMVLNQHIVNKKIFWKHASNNLLGWCPGFPFLFCTDILSGQISP